MDGNALLHKTTEKLLVLADAGIQFVVVCLDGAGFVEAALGEGAGKERDGGTHGQDALGVVGGNGRWGPDGETVGDGPVLDGLHQPVLLGGIVQSRGVGTPCERRHDGVCCVWCVNVCLCVVD